MGDYLQLSLYIFGLIILCALCMLSVTCCCIYRRRTRSRRMYVESLNLANNQPMHQPDTDIPRNSQTFKSLPDISFQEEKYYTATDVIPCDDYRLIKETDVCIIMPMKIGNIYSRWMGSITLQGDIGKCAVLTDLTEKVKKENIFHWESFLKKCLALPKSDYLVKIEGVTIQKINQFLISEHLDCESLDGLFTREMTGGRPADSVLSVTTLIKYISGILEGMEIIKTYGFLHPGLSTKKILLTQLDCCKLYEFCLADDAAKVAELKKKQMKSFSLNQFAPETLFSKEYTESSDVWSTAVVIWEILTAGALPFPVDKVVKSEMDVQLPKLSWPDKFLQLRNNVLAECWNLNCSLRPSIHHLRGSFLTIFEKLIVDSDYEIPIPSTYTAMGSTKRARPWKEDAGTLHDVTL
ncbi:uncharacterized protein [Apostichopus japonicus]|uniref:uncharacterized protein isoform X2 n=2 Tax=Stichopus japonicus TaxID=307972 RepID=UPI003AB6D858